jgi:GxxExxY protein
LLRKRYPQIRQNTQKEKTERKNQEGMGSLRNTRRESKFLTRSNSGADCDSGGFHGVRPQNLRNHPQAMEVHKHPGCGFPEPVVYQEALAVEFSKRAILFDREVTLPISYKTVRLDTPYRVDFICSEEVAVELKALARLSATEEAQLINYMKASGLETGLLLNFGTRSLEYRRFILSNSKKSV